ncbi:MAG: helix-turn-helix domain-containing protein [Cyanobacteria bacterium P01_G01_bin.49]
MKQTKTYSANHQQLSQLMHQAGITSVRQLSDVSGVSLWQLNRLLVGLMPKLPIEALLKLSKTLQVSVEQLLLSFEVEYGSIPSEALLGAETFKQEYNHLQQQLTQQKDTLEQDFQHSSLAVIESWLLQWPTAAIIAQKNPQLSAVKLLPLVKPIFELLKKWGLEMTATVGDKVAYDPQFHQLLEGGGSVQSGDLVMVRYVGYRQGDKLLYKAKVSPVSSSTTRVRC